MVSKTDPGFAAWRNTDPLVIAGLSGGATLGALDATWLLQNIALPSIPSIGSISFAPQSASSSTTTFGVSSLAPISVSAVASTTVTSDGQNGGSSLAQPATGASPAQANAPLIDFSRSGRAWCDAIEPEQAGDAWLSGFLSDGAGTSRQARNLGLKVTVSKTVVVSNMDGC